MSIIATTTAIDPVVSTLLKIGTTLIVIALIIGCIGFYLNLKALRREQAQGKQSRWYKHPGILTTMGSILLCISILLLISMQVRIIPPALFLFVIFFILVAIELALMIYSLGLNISLRKHKA